MHRSRYPPRHGFHFVTSDKSDDPYPLRVTQRDVIGLNSFGYKGEGEDLTTFVCRKTDQADAATLESYRKKVNSLTKAPGFTAEQ